MVGRWLLCLCPLFSQGWTGCWAPAWISNPHLCHHILKPELHLALWFPNPWRATGLAMAPSSPSPSPDHTSGPGASPKCSQPPGAPLPSQQRWMSQGLFLAAYSWTIWQREAPTLKWKYYFVNKAEIYHKTAVVPNSNHLFILFFSVSEEKCSSWMLCAQMPFPNETFCTPLKPNNRNSLCWIEMGTFASSSRSKCLENLVLLAYMLEPPLLIFFGLQCTEESLWAFKSKSKTFWSVLRPALHQSVRQIYSQAREGLSKWPAAKPQMSSRGNIQLGSSSSPQASQQGRTRVTEACF